MRFVYFASRASNSVRCDSSVFFFNFFEVRIRHREVVDLHLLFPLALNYERPFSALAYDRPRCDPFRLPPTGASWISGHST